MGYIKQLYTELQERMIMPVYYDVEDFIVDSRDEIDRLDNQYKKEKNADLRLMISKERDYAYKRGREMIEANKRSVPSCAIKYFEGKRNKPTLEEMQKGWERKHPLMMPIDRRVIRVSVYIALTILTILAILGVI